MVAPAKDFLPERPGGRHPDFKERPLDRLLVQHDGYVDPVFRQKLKEIAPDITVMWNRTTRRYSFYRRSRHRTGIGRDSFWKDPGNWYSGVPEGETRSLLRAQVAQDIEWRSQGLTPIMEHGPDDGPLNERVLLTILLGDDPNRPGLRDLIRRISAEAARKVSNGDDLDMVDMHLFRRTLQSQGSPYKGLIDPNVKAKLYRDDKRREQGQKPLSFATPAQDPPTSVSVPS